jgi:hypothetical protein
MKISQTLVLLLYISGVVIAITAVVWGVVALDAVMQDYHTTAPQLISEFMRGGNQ